jgi:hypothetical protein
VAPIRSEKCCAAARAGIRLTGSGRPAYREGPIPKQLDDLGRAQGSAALNAQIGYGRFRTTPATAVGSAIGTSTRSLLPSIPPPGVHYDIGHATVEGGLSCRRISRS